MISIFTKKSYFTFSIFLFLLSFSISSATTSPVGDWHLDDSSNSVIFLDSSSSGLNATCGSGGCPTAGVGGKVGTAASFGGSKSLQVGYSSSNPLFQFTGSKPFSVSVWINPNISMDGWRGIVGGDYTSNWLLCGGDNSNSLGFYIQGTRLSTPSNSVPLNTWTHVAVTFDGTTKSIYINGILSAQATVSGVNMSVVPALQIGANYYGNYFSGSMDEVKVYDRALSQSEVQTLAGSGGTNNQAPIVNAGVDQTITLPNTATLSGTASDDGLPAGSTLTTAWSVVSGAGTVTFSSANSKTTTATFSTSGGTYTLRLTASDGALFATDDVVVAVNPNGTNNNHPLVGAIRWDIWSTNGWQVSDEASLSPAKWHDRIPFYSVVPTDNSVQIRLNTQQQMDQEIAYAHAGGLDYWAFAYYGDANQYADALQKYLASSHKADMKFSLILMPQSIDQDPIGWKNAVINHLKNPQYIKVLGNRPLIYAFAADAPITKSNLDALRSATIAAGLANPYIVWMTGDPNDGGVSLSGSDAVSAYALIPTGANYSTQPYSNLLAVNQWFRDTAKSNGMKVVPIVNTGWDPTPRYEIPPPWQIYPSAVSVGSPSEIAGGLQSAFNWITANPSAGEANTVIMYAWNEFSEGGWLDPLVQSGSARLDALRQVIPGAPAGDIMPPVVSITSPAFNSTVSGSVTINASASDNVGVVGVQFKVDGVNLGSEDTSFPYSVSWNTNSVSSGSHTITATARDSANNQVTSVSIVVTVAVQQVQQNPIGLWPLNEGSGTITANSTAGGGSGTLINGPTWTTGKLSNALSFDGVDDQVKIDDSNLANLTTITLSAWVNPRTGGGAGTGQGRIISKGGLTSGNRRFLIQIGPDNSSVAFVASYTGAQGGWVTPAGSLPFNSWHHVVVTYTYGDPNNTPKIYIDGVLQQTSMLAMPTGSPVSDDSTLYIGSRGIDNAKVFDGVIDQVRVYDRLLSPAEITTLFDSEKGTQNLSASGWDYDLTKRCVKSINPNLANYYQDLTGCSSVVGNWTIAVESEKTLGASYPGPADQSFPVNSASSPVQLSWTPHTDEFGNKNWSVGLKTDLSSMSHPGGEGYFTWVTLMDHVNHGGGPLPRPDQIKFSATVNYSDYTPNGLTRGLVGFQGWWNGKSHQVEINFSTSPKWGDKNTDPDIINVINNSDLQFVNMDGSAIGINVVKLQDTKIIVDWNKIIADLVARGYLDTPTGGWANTASQAVYIGTEVNNLSAGQSVVSDLHFTNFRVESVPSIVLNVPTASLNVSPTYITKGSSTTLTWNTTNTASVSIDNGIGAVSSSGSVTVNPSVTSTYTVTATNSSGSVSASASVEVTPPTTIQIGSNILTTAKVNVRRTANGRSLGTQPLGSTGTIVGGPTSAGGLKWWNVNYTSGVDGWTAEQYLTLAAVGMTPITHTLTVGSTGQEVTTLQTLLSKLGYYKNEITGYFGTLTQDAVKSFQTANVIDAVGVVGPKTKALLNNVK